MPFGILKLLPQDYAADVYHKVRLEAGTVHLAKYLILVAVYILVAMVWFFFEMAMASYYSSAGGDARSESGMTDPMSGMPVGCALNIPAGQWHSLRALESGTVILEMKDGPYEPIQECDILK